MITKIYKKGEKLPVLYGFADPDDFVDFDPTTDVDSSYVEANADEVNISNNIEVEIPWDSITPYDGSAVCAYIAFPQGTPDFPDFNICAEKVDPDQWLDISDLWIVDDVTINGGSYKLYKWMGYVDTVFDFGWEGAGLITWLFKYSIII